MTLRAGDSRLPVRLAAYGAAAGLHALVLLGVALPHPALSSPVETIEISIAPQQGDATPEMNQEQSRDAMAQEKADPNAKPDPAPENVVDPPPQPPAPQEEQPAQVAAEPPKREVEDAIAVARQQREKHLEELREKREELEERREEERRREARHRRIQAQKAAAQAAHRARAGVSGGADSGVSRANYGALFRAEIRRRQIHATGFGSVGVSFNVGASGHVTGASVASSSGDGGLDAAALRMVRSSNAGPPPGGAFSGMTTINFIAH